MAKVTKLKETLKDAASIRTVWETIPSFSMGNVSLTDFIAAHDAAVALDKDYAKKDVELTGLKSSRDDSVHFLNELVTRFRSTIRGVYGPDSALYGQTGATRMSERKSRRAKAVPAPA